jgi:hypothetical protein
VTEVSFCCPVDWAFSGPAPISRAVRELEAAVFVRLLVAVEESKRQGLAVATVADPGWPLTERR